MGNCLLLPRTGLCEGCRNGHDSRLVISEHREIAAFLFSGSTNGILQGFLFFYLTIKIVKLKVGGNKNFVQSGVLYSVFLI